jgi:hypothetical protein
MDNSRLQMDLESRFVIKPAPRTDKEVLIKRRNKKNNDSYKKQNSS